MKLGNFNFGDRVEDKIVFISEINKQEKTSGKIWAFLTVKDNSASLPLSPFWEGKDIIENFKVGDYCKVSGEIVTYQGGYQIFISNPKDFTKVTDESIIDPMDFMESYPEKVIESNRSRLLSNINSIEGKYGEILRKIYFEEKIEILPEKFENNYEAVCVWPGAKKHHHYQIGGLNQHLLECDDMILALTPSMIKKGVIFDLELLRAANYLSDIMKLVDYKFSPDVDSPFYKYGSHVLTGREIIAVANAKYKLLSFEEEAKLKYLISAHHGQFGPQDVDVEIPESYILHNVDMLSTWADKTIQTQGNK